jgi:hypothetical protein
LLDQVCAKMRMLHYSKRPPPRRPLARPNAPYVLFNNCFRSQAAVNARRIETLMARQPGLVVAPPPAASVPEQRWLFDDAPSG